MLCFDESEFEVKGSYFSEEYKYVDINISKCTNGTGVVCQDDATIDAALEKAIFEIYFVHKFANFTNYKDSLPFVLEQRWYYYVDSTRTIHPEIFIEKNEALF